MRLGPLPSRFDVRGEDGDVTLFAAPDEQALLDAARAAGRVVLFEPVAATLAELFREAVGHFVGLRVRFADDRGSVSLQTVLLVAKREIVTRVRERSFLIATLVTIGHPGRDRRAPQRTGFR